MVKSNQDKLDRAMDYALPIGVALVALWWAGRVNLSPIVVHAALAVPLGWVFAGHWLESRRQRLFVAWLVAPGGPPAEYVARIDQAWAGARDTWPSILANPRGRSLAHALMADTPFDMVRHAVTDPTDARIVQVLAAMAAQELSLRIANQAADVAASDE